MSELVARELANCFPDLRILIVEAALRTEASEAIKVFPTAYGDDCVAGTTAADKQTWSIAALNDLQLGVLNSKATR